MRMNKPVTVRDTIYQAIEDTETPEEGMEQMAYRPRPAPAPAPNWRDQATEPKRPPGSQYETGDPALDDFRRKQHLGGPDQDDPFANAYNDPKEAKRILEGAYYAGASGDDAQILEIINGPYGNTPFGRLMKRAYEDGRKTRARQQPGPRPQPRQVARR